jgi:hypothetical protein
MSDALNEVAGSRLGRTAVRIAAACGAAWRLSRARAISDRTVGEFTVLGGTERLRLLGYAVLSALATGGLLSLFAPEGRPWPFRIVWLIVGAAAVLCAFAPGIAMALAAGRKE